MTNAEIRKVKTFFTIHKHKEISSCWFTLYPDKDGISRHLYVNYHRDKKGQYLTFGMVYRPIAKEYGSFEAFLSKYVQKCRLRPQERF